MTMTIPVKLIASAFAMFWSIASYADPGTKTFSFVNKSNFTYRIQLHKANDCIINPDSGEYGVNNVHSFEYPIQLAAGCQLGQISWDFSQKFADKQLDGIITYTITDPFGTAPSSEIKIQKGADWPHPTPALLRPNINIHSSSLEPSVTLFPLALYTIDLLRARDFLHFGIQK